jgi:hypothetical protein
VPTSSVLTREPPISYTGSAISSDGKSCVAEIYLFEAENLTGAVPKAPFDRTCLVVGGKYDADGDDDFDEETETYYRADFSDESSGTEVFLDVLRNHHYTFNITDVSGPGYGSSVDAFCGEKIDFTVTVTPWDGENWEIPLEWEVPLQPTSNCFIVETKKTIAIPIMGQIQQAISAGRLPGTWINEATMNLRGELIWAENGKNNVVKSYTVNAFKSDQNKYGIPILTVAANYEGNALVGVYNDANGNRVRDTNEGYLWSWHIWVTNYNPEADYATGPGATVWMTRNLGAYNNNNPGTASSFGMYYQWGRKDPFPAASTVYDKNGAVKPVATTGLANTLASSVQNPFCIGAVWDPRTTIPNAWGAGSTKTAFDPCPTGWRVPARGIWGTQGSDWYNNQSTGNIFRLTSPNMYYPSVGDYTGNGNLVFGSEQHGHYWTNEMGTTYPWHFCLNYNRVYIERSQLANSANHGYVIRCIRGN